MSTSHETIHQVNRFLQPWVHQYIKVQMRWCLTRMVRVHMSKIHQKPEVRKNHIDSSANESYRCTMERFKASDQGRKAVL